MKTLQMRPLMMDIKSELSQSRKGEDNREQNKKSGVVSRDRRGDFQGTLKYCFILLTTHNSLSEFKHFIFTAAFRNYFPMLPPCSFCFMFAWKRIPTDLLSEGTLCQCLVSTPFTFTYPDTFQRSLYFVSPPAVVF